MIGQKETFLGLTQRNIDGIGQLEFGLGGIYFALNTRRLGIDPKRQITDFKQWADLGTNALKLLPLAQRIIKAELVGKRLTPELIKPHVRRLEFMAEDVLLDPGYEPQRQMLFQHTTVNSDTLKPYQETLKDLLKKRRWIVRGATAIAGILPAAAAIVFGAENRVFFGSLGLAAGVISAAVVNDKLNGFVENKVAQEISKRLPQATRFIPSSSKIAQYRDLIESAIPTEYPAQDFRTDCANLFDEARRFAESEIGWVGNNPKQWGEDFIYALKSEYNNFLDNPDRYPFFQAMLRTFEHKTGKSLHLTRVYLDDNLEETAILAPEIYFSMAVMANKWSGEMDDDAVDRKIYYQLRNSGSVKRSFAMNFPGTVYDRYGIHPVELGSALVEAAKGLSQAFPESRQTVLDDFDELVQQITQIQ